MPGYGKALSKFAKKYGGKASSKLQELAAEGIVGGAKGVAAGEVAARGAYNVAKKHPLKTAAAAGAAGYLAGGDDDDSKKKKKKRPYMED